MPFVAAPNIVMVELRMTLDGQNVENRWHVNCFHEPTPADLTAIGNNIFTIVTTDWVAETPDEVTYREIHLRSLHEQNGIEDTVVFPIPTIGSLVGAQLPNNVTICVSLRSGSAGRSARGRLYWPALVEADVNANELSAGRGGTIVAAVQSMIDTLETAAYPWTIVSYIANGAPRVGGPVYFLVQNALLVDNVVDSQRGRLPGRGN